MSGDTHVDRIAGVQSQVHAGPANESIEVLPGLLFPYEFDSSGQDAGLKAPDRTR